jgi:hypothetical protein
MRDAARDVGEGVTVNVHNVVSVSTGATVGELPDESRARVPPSAGACCATLDVSSHDT